MLKGFSKTTARRALSTALVATIMTVAAPTFAQSEVSAKPAYVLKDVRNVDKGEIRRLAALGAENLPVIVLFGVDKAALDKVKSAALEAESKGYGVKAILVGPTNVAPALEIYANTKTLGKPKTNLGAFNNAWKVTEDINPLTVTQLELVKLLRDIHKAYYPTN